MNDRTTDSNSGHRPVLLAEVLSLLDPHPGEIWVDATFGLGGHGRVIAERVGDKGLVIGLDQDAQMLQLARQQGLPPQIRLFHASFDQMQEVLKEVGIRQVDGLFADIGVNSAQLSDPERGFSFQHDGPLDMRMNREVGEPASSLLARLSERELADLFWEYGEERKSYKVARKIVNTRKEAPITTTAQLATLVRNVVPWSRSRTGSIDPATRVFQALRIAVNDELGALQRLLKILPSCIRLGGRVGIISFHSLEDRLVKQTFRNGDVWHVLTHKPVQPTEVEIAQNPRSRSAKLRVAVRKNLEGTPQTATEWRRGDRDDP